jgi:hypothetical protein
LEVGSVGPVGKEEAATMGQYSNLIRDMIAKDAHHAGSMNGDVLEVMADFLASRRIASSLETGCGRSTALISQFSSSHHVFTFDDRDVERSSVRLAESFMGQRAKVAWHFGPTQQTLLQMLPTALSEAGLDFALIDGPHGYPFPELEYWAIYPHMHEGAILVVDDIHIPTVRNLFEFLSADDMFNLCYVAGMTAFFRRREARTFPALGDRWYEQNYNIARFPCTIPVFVTAEFNERYQFIDGQNRGLLGRGWRQPEPKGVWSIAPNFTLRFLLPSQGPCVLNFEFWTHDENEGKPFASVCILPEKGPVSTRLLHKGTQTAAVQIPARSDTAPITVEFAAPWAHPHNPDAALFECFGIFLISAEIRIGTI